MAALRCPFQSNWAYNGVDAVEFNSTNCIEELCEIWDTTNSRCGALTSDTLLSQASILEEQSTLISAQSTILTSQTTLITAQNALMSPDSSNSMTQANDLMQEYMVEKDIDGNGKVYSVDFGISDPPNMFTSLQNGPTWSNPSCNITLTQYSNWVAGLYSPFDKGGVCGSSGITVLSPIGGEEWMVADSHTIIWQSDIESANVGLYYSTNSGSTWTLINASQLANGTYSWTIPSDISSNCLVEVRDSLDPTVSGRSAAVFSIIPIPPPFGF